MSILKEGCVVNAGVERKGRCCFVSGGGLTKRVAKGAYDQKPAVDRL